MSNPVKTLVGHKRGNDHYVITKGFEFYCDLKFLPNGEWTMMSAAGSVIDSSSAMGDLIRTYGIEIKD